MYDSNALRDYAELISDLRKGAATVRFSHFRNRVGIAKIAFGGLLLGSIWGSHVALAVVFSTSEGSFALFQWCAYAISLTTFHIMEFLVTALFNPDSATYDSFLINHSTAYTIAAVVSWIEFWAKFLLERYADVDVSIPSRAALPVGLLLIVFGQIARSSAMWTARHNFNHIVQERRKGNHTLVTSGIYKYFRHPSYVGFFYWSIGTQVLLGNPFCVVAYALASWFFFNKRIPPEERYLSERIFPDEYPAYMRRSYIGIPFIRGYVPDVKRKP